MEGCKDARWRLRDAKILGDAMVAEVKTEAMTSPVTAHEVWKLCCGYCPEKELLIFYQLFYQEEMKSDSSEIKSRML